ncbi:hypothetical protein KDD30_09470 [Photobacterium sp. GJ3]|uniref:DUF7709 family protein n=1 Tax=Photobacterium sp. GJ3 TaxID=2829502 RepID=UPI001B8C72D8|nr:hypothetical protein [Photobacterium sp. GJ3]QUJ66407.1 hypothetical protein KDD30_09470 [Photobacterium sp. GJ3]
MSDSITENTQQLGAVNQKVVAEGERLPAVKLKDGTQVQTGTVAAMLHNIERFNAGHRDAVEAELEMAVPTLVKIGLFDLFCPDEWINGNNAGRRFVGRKAKQYLDSEKAE